MNIRPRLPAVEVAVTDHARERARERFPGFKSARIIDEVRAALLENRVSPGEDGRLIATVLDSERAYVLYPYVNAMVVLTTIRRVAA